MDLTVLLIDDDPLHAQGARQYLGMQRPAWQVHWAGSLGQAKALHAVLQPQVVLVKCDLPDGKAVEALTWLGNSVAMVMVLSGQEALAAQAMELGFLDFVVQPAEGAQQTHLQTLPAQMERLVQQRATEQALEARSKELQATLARISQGVISTGEDGRIQVFNARAQELIGVPHQLNKGDVYLSDLVEFQRARGEFGQDGRLYWPPGGRLSPFGGSECPDMYIRCTPEGRYLEVRTHLEDDGGSVRTYTDVTDYVRVQEQLRQSEKRWRSMTALSSDWFWELDTQLRFTMLDGCPSHMQRGLKGQQLDACLLWDEGSSTQALHTLRKLLQEQEAFQNWEACLAPGVCGQKAWLSLSGTPVLDADGEFSGYCGVARDITQRRKDEAQIRRLAYYDDLTGLPNRAAILQQLGEALERSQRRGAGALLLVDVERFREINDSMGFQWGDALLQEVAERLRLWCRPGDVVGRVAGDEFLLFVEGLAPDMAQAQARAAAMAASLLGVLGQAFVLQGRPVQVSFCIGVAGFQGLEQSVDGMRQCVELALGAAKQQGSNAWSVFDPALQKQLRARAQLEQEMHVGLEQRQFLLHYQPLVDAQGKVLGAEALVRWRHPRRGMVSPAEFIPVAEQLGLIFALDHAVLRMACQQLAQWAGHPVTAQWTLSVNLSAQEFRHANFVQRIQDILRDTGARADRLKLELTETLMLDAVEASIAKMQMLRGWGIRFSLDDFGTGYSSLGYLKRLPLSQLKVDQSFVRDVLVDANDAAIVRTVINLGQSLGLEVVAEGVETLGQRDFLMEHGCQCFQGYLFGRPQDADALFALGVPQKETIAGNH